jgi:hypothetical protein
MKAVLVILVNVLLSSCSGPERHNGTKKICDGKFYVEISTEWSEMGVCYLTDSVNFRVKIDRYNFESEYFKFHCNTDSLIAELWSNYPLPEHILKTKTFYFKKLIEEGNLIK